MDPLIIAAEEAQGTSHQELFRVLQSSPEGLSTDEARKRLAAVGPNRLEECKQSVILKFLKYFWGPIPWLIEAAAILSVIIRHWIDFYIILALLLINGLIEFFEELQAANAIEALKKHLASKSLVKRDGKWVEVTADELVPGDCIQLKLGDIIPADVKLYAGDYLTIDQSTLTGESLPVIKKKEETAYAGSIVRQGEMTALVTATGKNTFFGKTAKLVGTAKPVSHFQHAVLQIGDYLIYISFGLAALLVIVQLDRGTPWVHLLQYMFILIVASIPVAMPAVLSVTMAIGALKLSRMHAVVTRLESIEEMAGIDVLCCDKTGTLTLNQLKLGEPLPMASQKKDTVILFAALASERESQDPIDLAVFQGVHDTKALDTFQKTHFIPFDPMRKRTEATVQEAKGPLWHVTKGAPQVILALGALDPKEQERMEKAVEEFGKRGYRTLGVARSWNGTQWECLGLLPLFDPLRSDAKEVIGQARSLGIEVKMLTGDNQAIAKETAHALAIGDTILLGEELAKQGVEALETSAGIAQVFPEHKFDIVKALQKKNHVVGMTGDGVNDAPALKQADVGIAVSQATDAARSAASLVLLEPGLSVIIKAIQEARCIFERMNSYAIYRIAETLAIMLFMVACILIYNLYPITALMIIMLALLNDLPIMAIAYDHTLLDPSPVRWQMNRVISIATVLGFINIIETFLAFVIARDWLGTPLTQLQSLIFLQLSLGGHLTLFVARTKKFLLSKPYPSPILLAAILGTQGVAALIVGFGFLVPKIPWSYVGYIWLYCLGWVFLQDIVKFFIHRHLDHTSISHQKFLRSVKQPRA